MVIRKEDQVAPLVPENGLIDREGAGLLVGIGQPLAGELAGFHIGLIERVDTHDRPRHCSGELPAKELARKVVAIGQRDLYDRLPGLGQSLDCFVLGQPQVDQEAILSIVVRRAELFPIHGDHGLAVLAGGLGHQLFQPGSQVANSRRADQRQLVALETLALTDHGSQ